MPAQSSERASLRRYTRWGALVIAIPVLGFVAWAAMAQISGAVVAPGRVAVESSVKRVQHKEGGIVTSLLVSEGDHVTEGQVLATLDSTVIQANLNAVETQLMQLTARQLRLQAERDGRRALATPPADMGGPDFTAMLTAEQSLLRQRALSNTQKKQQLEQEVSQSEREIDGLKAQVAAQASQHRLADGELEGLTKLYDQDYVPITRLDELKREKARLEGQQGELEASVARAQARIAETKIQILQTDSEMLTQVMSDLKETEIKVAELVQQRATLRDQLQRVQVRSPRTGYVHQLAVHTVGGVVGPGETMMFVVPEKEALIVEARVDPQHVDQVGVGRPAHVRFTAFSARTTPEITAHVDRLSADATVDDKTGASYYLAEMSIDPQTLPAEIRGRLLPGMPAEVHIETVRRNALSYFLKPLTDQIARSFREG
jgi:HlyD family secretion protein